MTVKESTSPTAASPLPGLEPIPILDQSEMSPRSPLDIDRVSDHCRKGDKSELTLPKAPTIKKVSFLTYETIPTGTQHTEETTEETVSTIKEEMNDYYDDCDDETEHDYDDLDYADGDHDDHSYEDHPDEDPITTNSPPGAAEGTKKSSLPTKNVRRRKIRWSGQVRVQEIRHLNNMPESEREAVWMSPIDYKLIKNMAKTTVLMMMAGEHIDDEDPDYCTRGLEFRTRKGSKIRSANKLRGRSAVLNEQDLQREEGFHDPEFIAMASLDVSFECREQAQKRAEEDAKSISSYVSDVPRDIKVLLF